MGEGNWDYNPFWDEALKEIQHEISEQEFVMWFKNLVYEASEESQIILSVPSTFYKDQIIQRYAQKMETILLNLVGSKITLKFTIKSRATGTIPDKSDNESEKSAQKEKQNKSHHPLLKKEYTFENFVIGNNNSFAANAAYAIAKNPGSSYNPCLIYGGVGLGKTHLIQSIGNAAYNDFPKMKVLYVPAETFINDFIFSLKDNSTYKFKNKYRSVDILLIDDIHYFQNKSETQEELFHTFNALYDSNKQMVFTCDRPVNELKDLTDRLKSRFGRGLNVDLQPPNFETRIAILKKKIEVKNIQISDEVIEMVCKNITSNVRDLEKALTKLVAYADLVNKEITLDIAERQLGDFFSDTSSTKVSMEIIKKTVTDYFGLTSNEINSKKRTKAISYPRQVAMYIARELTEFSTTEIGLEFGGRDHTTVMHACQKIEDRIKTDPSMEPTLAHLIRMIRDNKNS